MSRRGDHLRSARLVDTEWPNARPDPRRPYVGGAGGHGLNVRVTDVRVMDQTPQHARRVVYMNGENQPVNPLTGQFVGKNDFWAHIPW